MNDPVTLNTIGNDGLYHILKWLGPRDLATCSKVCSAWQQLLYDNAFWRYWVHKDLPHFTIPEDSSYWIHYNCNAYGLPFKSIHVHRSGIYSAWGKTIAVWKRRIGLQPVYDFYQTTTTHTAAINCFAVRQIGLISILLTGSCDGTLKMHQSLLNGHEFHELQSAKVTDAPLKSIEIVSSYMLACSSSGFASLWKYSAQSNNFDLLENGKNLQQKGLHLSATVPKTNQFITVGNNNSIKFWLVQRRKLHLISTIEPIEEKITCITYCNFLNILLVGTAGGSLKFFRPGLHGVYECFQTVQLHTDKITAISTVSKDQYILTAGAEFVIKVCKINTKDHEIRCIKEIFQTEENLITSISGLYSQQTKGLKQICYSSTQQINVLTLLDGQIKDASFKVGEPHLVMDRTTKVKLLPDSPRAPRKLIKRH